MTLEMTQAEFDAAIASGELSLPGATPEPTTTTAPAPESSPTPVDVKGLFDGIETSTPAPEVTPAPTATTQTEPLTAPIVPEQTVTVPAPVVTPADHTTDMEPATPSVTEPAEVPGPTIETDTPTYQYPVIHPETFATRNRKSKEYQKYLEGQARIQTQALKLSDPQKRQEIFSLLEHQARNSDTAAMLAVFQQQERDAMQKTGVPATKRYEEIYKRLNIELEGIGDADARMEALQVINDPTMEESNKIKAMAAYLKSFPATRDGVKEDRWMGEIEKLEALPARTAAQESRLSTLRKLMSKATAVSMSDLSKKQSDLKGFEQTFRSSLPPEMADMGLSEIDIRTLTPKQRAEASALGNWTLKAQGVSAASSDKEMRDIITQTEQAKDAMDYTMKALSSGKEFNAINLKKRELLSNYTGLSQEDMARAFRDKRAQALINKYRHGLFGGALSKTEKPEFEKEAATLYQSNSNLALAISSILANNIAKMEGIRATMSPTAFNLKYGDRYRDLLEFNDANRKALGVARSAVGENDGYEVIAEQKSETPEAPHPISREDMPDGRVKVTFSDGSVKYGRKR